MMMMMMISLGHQVRLVSIENHQLCLKNEKRNHLNPLNLQIISDNVKITAPIIKVDKKIVKKSAAGADPLADLF